MKQAPSCGRPETLPTTEVAVDCDECGAAGAHVFGEVRLCVDCYAGKGSCCPEFGKDDLWEGRLQD